MMNKARDQGSSELEELGGGASNVGRIRGDAQKPENDRGKPAGAGRRRGSGTKTARRTRTKGEIWSGRQGQGDGIDCDGDQREEGAGRPAAKFGPADSRISEETEVVRPMLAKRRNESQGSAPKVDCTGIDGKATGADRRTSRYVCAGQRPTAVLLADRGGGRKKKRKARGETTRNLRRTLAPRINFDKTGHSGGKIITLGRGRAVRVLTVFPKNKGERSAT